MSKTAEEACRHAHKCRGCKLWYCSDDEIVHCEECVWEEDALCYRCLGFNYPWKTICKYHKSYAPLCTSCGGRKRHYREKEENKIECLSCYKRKHLGKSPRQVFLDDIRNNND